MNKNLSTMRTRLWKPVFRVYYEQASLAATTLVTENGYMNIDSQHKRTDPRTIPNHDQFFLDIRLSGGGC
jgi:hypothetical protein